ARSLTLSSKARAAKKALLNGWTAAPHPLIAAAYLENIPDPIERVQAAIAAGLTDKRPYAVLTALGDTPVDAPAPKWTCQSCHTEHADWHATCPSCGKAGTLTWKSASSALVTA
ncbi:MAG: hypothetical protein B7Z80_24365, partial [Rhodospirillales bacterium 20-64-7]